MSQARKIRAAIKKLLEPHLQGEGFTGTYPHFRRREGERLHVLSVIHDKWGGGFVLEFADHAPGPLTTSWGAVVEEAELEVGYVNPSHRARLVRTDSGQATYEDFFRYDGLGEEPMDCEALVAEVVARFSQVNAWLRTGKPGANISMFASPEER